LNSVTLQNERVIKQGKKEAEKAKKELPKELHIVGDKISDDIKSSCWGLRFVLLAPS